MKTRKLFSVLMLFIGVMAFAQNADDKKVIQDAENAKAAFIKANPNLQSYFDDAEAYIIFPNVGKGAFIIGAASGNGAVYENGKLIGMADLKKVDVGAQLGGKAFSEVIFLETEEAVREFKGDEFQLAGNISAIAADKSSPSLNLNHARPLAP